MKNQRNSPYLSNTVIHISIVSITLLKRYSLPLFLLFLFSHCSTSRMMPQQSDYESNLSKINNLGLNYSSKIYLLDNTIIYPYHFNVSRDSLTFSNSDNESFHKIPISQLAKITIKDNTASLFGGFWIGLGSGVLATLISAAIMDCKTCHPNIGPLIIGVIAVPIGFITGYIFTGEKEFIFNDTHH